MRREPGPSEAFRRMSLFVGNLHVCVTRINVKVPPMLPWGSGLWS
jgi:hypothetical protein